MLEDHGLTAWPKTSGLARLPHLHPDRAALDRTAQVRLAAETVAREVENRAPDLATSKWWKEERQGVFVDFNQNAKDRTVASAYSVRPDAGRPGVDAADLGRGAATAGREQFTLPRGAASGSPRSATRGPASMDAAAGSLEPLLELAERLGPAEKPPKGTGRPARRRCR